MLELRQPLHFERLPEFRRVVLNIHAAARPEARLTPKLAEALATFLWLRLWVDLGYLAQSTNRPGWLARGAAEEFCAQLGDLFGDGVTPLQLLADAGDGVQFLTPLADGEYECPLFARLNAHLSGDFMTKEDRGNQASIVSRRQKEITQAATAQAMLFGERVTFTTPTGEPLQGQELNRCTVIIKNIDSSLELPERRTEQFNQGLYSDAYQVMLRFPPPKGDKEKDHPLLKFYQWLYINRFNRGLPKVRPTEEILANFDVWFKAAGLAGK